jgi:hypothetical protein
LLSAVLDCPREPFDGRTHREQRVHLGRLEVVAVKLAMRGVLVRIGDIRGGARILQLLSASPRIRRTLNTARVPVNTSPWRALWGRGWQDRKAAGRRRGRRRLGGLPRERLRLGGAPYLLRSARADRCQRPPVRVLLRSRVLLPRLFPRALRTRAVLVRHRSFRGGGRNR